MKIWYNIQNFSDSFISFVRGHYAFMGTPWEIAVFFVVFLIGMREVLAEIGATGISGMKLRVFVFAAKAFVIAWIASIMTAFVVHINNTLFGGL